MPAQDQSTKALSDREIAITHEAAAQQLAEYLRTV